MTAINWFALGQATMPETILEVTALLVLLVDIAFLRRTPHWVRFRVAALLSMVGIVAAAFAILCVQHVNILTDGMVLITPMGKLVELGLLGITALCLMLTLDENFTDHVGEYVALMLFAAIGCLLLVTTLHLLIIFIALELLSLSLYILTAFNKHSIQSSEAALKYFLFGGTSAAMLLFGFSLLYGLSGSCNVGEIAAALALQPFTPLLVLAELMVLIGLGFKVAAAPLHWWAPDVYQGAPAPSAMFIASASKLASFFVFWKLLLPGLDGLFASSTLGEDQWTALTVLSENFHKSSVPALITLAVISMLWGNLAALAQKNVRSLLAYSAVAHTGYILLAFLFFGPALSMGIEPALIFYVLTYSIAVIGAFGVAAIVERQTGGSDLKNFAGLSKRSPLLAFCMLIFVLSLAGIPPLAGFIAKFNLFAIFWQSEPQYWWLVALAIAMSAVSLYYYLQVLKQVYVVEPESANAAASDGGQQSASLITKFVLLLCAASVIALGCFPQALLSLLSQTASRF
jgi:NADH-quinone oxidoreductase subunit N